MANFKIPTQQGIRQLNVNDTAGELWNTFNIDLITEPGKIKLARPFSVYLDTETLIGSAPEGDSVVQAIIYGDVRDGGGDIFTLTNDKLFRNGSFLSNTPDEALDATIFDGKLIFTTSGDLDYHSGSSTFQQNWWSALGSAPTLQTVTKSIPAEGNFIIETSRIGEETLIVLDGSDIHSLSGSTSSGTFFTVSLDQTLKATCVSIGVSRAWIGTTSTTSDQAYVYRWDTASTEFDAGYPTGAKAVLAIAMVDNTPLIVTERGDIKLFNGVGFTKIGQFPFSTKPLFLNEYRNRKQTQTIIHPKGIKVVEDNVYMYINPADGTVPIDERSPAGLWVFNIGNKSLNHMASVGGDSDVTNNSPIIVLPNNDDGRIYFAGNRGYGDNTVDGVFREDLSSSSTNGYITTVEIESNSVEDTFKEVITKALHNNTSEIVVKYRTANIVDYPLTFEGVAWLNENTFNTTSDLSEVKTRFDNGERDEIEIIKGTNAGKLSHITNITHSGNTYSVTIDENYGTANESFDIRVDNWSKVPETFTSSDLEVKRLGLDASGAWIQVRLELRGSEGLPEIRQIIINSNAKEEL